MTDKDHAELMAGYDAYLDERGEQVTDEMLDDIFRDMDNMQKQPNGRLAVITVANQNDTDVIVKPRAA